MRVRIDADFLHFPRFLASQAVELGDAFQFLSEEGQSPCAIFKVCRPDFQAVAAHPECAALKRLIVATVLLGNQIGHDLALIVFAPRMQVERHCTVGFDRSDAIDTGYGGDDDHIVTFQKGTGRRMAHPIDLVVDLAFFLDVGVRPRNIGLGLVIVVEADEVLDRVFREEAFHLAIKLSGKSFVRGEDNRRSLRFFDDLGHRVGLSGPSCAQQDLVLFAVHDTLSQFTNGRGLISSGVKFRVHDNSLSAFQLFARCQIR